jgi:hypothetical protein
MSNPFQNIQQVDAASVGRTGNKAIWVDTRDPTSDDVNFNVSQLWLNTTDEDLWILDSFTSSQGNLQANWINSGTSGIFSIQADSGTATPVDGVVILSGGTTGLTTTASSNEVDLTGTLNVSHGGTGQVSLGSHSVLIGNGTSAISSTGPSIASGIPLISQGISTNPIFSTATVQGGGTGKTSFTAYSVVCAGTTATGAFQNVSGVGTSGQVLTSNGASALPSWQTMATSIGSVNVQVFSTAGTFTYTPTSGMVGVIVQAIGGGGGGGGAAATNASVSAGSGGASGDYVIGNYNAATIGASQSVTIGAAGAGASAGNNNGGAGGDTLFGSLITASGGNGGFGAPSADTTCTGGGVGAGTSSGGTFRTAGQGGGASFGVKSSSTSAAFGGSGGSTFFGGGGTSHGVSTTSTSSTAGNNGTGNGSGGSGGESVSFTGASAAAAGGDGAAGIIVITEYIS